MSQHPTSRGLLFALLAYGSWGIHPLYWKLFGHTSALEIVSHRVIWSLFLLAILVVAFRQTPEFRGVLCDTRKIGALFVTASLLSVNWGIFIFGVLSGQVVQTSLGYFLNPLVSILLALVFLRERLNRWQVVAVILATAGVVHFGWHLGRWPWIALSLAVTFGLYGLLRKVIAVTPLVGLMVETILMTPVAAGIIVYLVAGKGAAFGASWQLTLLFLGGGFVTTIPLLWFNLAAKLLPLTTMGFLQYLAPTLQLLIGVLVFKEAFTHREGISFLLIWLAIAIYLATILRAKKTPSIVLNAD